MPSMGFSEAFDFLMGAGIRLVDQGGHIWLRQRCLRVDCDAIQPHLITCEHKVVVLSLRFQSAHPPLVFLSGALEHFGGAVAVLQPPVPPRELLPLPQCLCPP